MLNAFYANIATNLSNTVKTWPGYENIANKLKILPQIIHDRMYDKLYDAYHPRINGFNVITHGDMFLNNILFRYDANKNPFDIRFVSIKSVFHLTFSNLQSFLKLILSFFFIPVLNCKFRLTFH